MSLEEAIREKQRELCELLDQTNRNYIVYAEQDISSEQFRYDLCMTPVSPGDGGQIFERLFQAVNESAATGEESLFTSAAILQASHTCLENLVQEYGRYSWNQEQIALIESLTPGYCYCIWIDIPEGVYGSLSFGGEGLVWIENDRIYYPDFLVTDVTIVEGHQRPSTGVWTDLETGERLNYGGSESEGEFERQGQ